MSNISTRIADALTKHGIDLMRVDADMRYRVDGLINGLEQDIIKKLNRIDPSAPGHLRFREQRLENLLALTNESFKKVYDEIMKIMLEDLTDIAVAEGETSKNTINTLVKAAIAGGAITVVAARKIVRDALIRGATQRRWWMRQRDEMIFDFEREVRQGIIAGEDLGTIIARVRGSAETGFRSGVMPKAKRQASTLIRTSVQVIANNARMEIYQQNRDILKGYQWLSVLDSRTSDICRALDGQAWDLDGKPLAGTTQFFIGPPPAHWNCRSSLIPVLKSWDELEKTGNRVLKSILAAANVTQRTRRSMDGDISSDMTYEDWLKTKSPNFAKKVLGPTKYRLWSKGQISFSDLIDQTWNPLSVGDLKRKAQQRGSRV